MKVEGKKSNMPQPPPGRLAQLIASVLFKFYVLVLHLLSRSTHSIALPLSRLVNPLFTYPLRRQRRKNIALLFPDSVWTDEQRRQLEKDYLKYLAFVRVEMARIFLTQSPKEVKQESTISGIEHLQAALDQGKGVLLIECHFGHWNCTASLLSSLGYPITVVLNPNPVRGANFRQLHEKGTRTMGIKVAFVGQDAYSSARDAFRKNNIFYLNIDVAVRSKHSQWLPFGKAAIEADPGPAIVALRHRVPVIFAKSILTEHGAAITLTPAVNAATDKPSPESLLRAWLDTFYNAMLEHPAQWWALNYISLADASVLKHEPPPAATFNPLVET
jgi:lauroyl/myristoyl acyltransferase